MAEIDWKLVATSLYLERSGEETKSLAVMMYENALAAESPPRADHSDGCGAGQGDSGVTSAQNEDAP